MNTPFKYFLYLITCAVFFSCKKPYLPPVINAPGSYLVVEGVITGGTTLTTVKLSYTVNLSNVSTASPASKAVVTVENDQSVIYPLTEATPGTYVLAGLSLDNSRKYRIRIKTADNKQYLSDFVPVVNSPPIDSVGYQVANNGLNIYSNTHDPKNSTRYYRWDYQETWIIHSNYFSYFKSNGDTVLGRDLINDNIYQCWASDTSSTLILNSSARLVNDVISDNPITFIPSTSGKIGVKYSILVNQYALTGDAYAFWTNLKKNTEQLGSIFDAQPSQIDGNVHCISNPAEAVIGYISVGNVATKRIFITNQQLPNWLPTPAYPNCILDTFLYKYTPPHSNSVVNQVNEFINYHKGATYPEIPIDAIGRPGDPQPLGFTASEPECVDCTLRGTNKQPAFWK
jgi:hypothetical protein